MTYEPCPTCKGTCCADKYNMRGPHVPFDDPYSDSFIYWDHTCEDCRDGTKFVPQRTAEQEREAVVKWLRQEAYLTLHDDKPHDVADRIERGEHRKENE